MMPTQAEMDERLGYLLEHSQVVEDPDRPGYWKPSGGSAIHLASTLIAFGGVIQFERPVSSIYFLFPPGPNRQVWAWSDHSHVRTQEPYPVMTPPYREDVLFGFGLGVHPPIVAVKVMGSFMIEDVAYAD